MKVFKHLFLLIFMLAALLTFNSEGKAAIISFTESDSSLACLIDITETSIDLSYPGGASCPPNSYQLHGTGSGCPISNLNAYSSNDSVAVVDSNGKITATGPGTCIITVECTSVPGCLDTCQVNVTTCPLPCSINITEDQVNLSFPGGTGCPPITTQLHGDVQGCPLSDLSGSSSNNSVAVVDSSGKITATGPGTCTITIECTSDPGCLDTCQVTVITCPSPCNIDITEDQVNLSYPSGEGCLPKWAQLHGDMESCPLSDISGSSSNEDVAVVDSNGRVGATGVGSCTITIECLSDPSCFDTCEVVVIGCPCQVQIVEYLLDLSYPGGGDCLPNESYLTTNVYGCSGIVEYMSTDEKVAIVDEAGKVTAVGLGDCGIYAGCSTDNTCHDRCEVSVTNCPLIAVEPLDDSGNPGDYIGIEVVISNIIPDNLKAFAFNLEYNEDSLQCLKYAISDDLEEVGCKCLAAGVAQVGWMSEIPYPGDMITISVVFKVKGTAVDASDLIINPDNFLGDIVGGTGGVSTFTLVDCPLANSGDVDSSGAVEPDDALDALLMYILLYDEFLPCATKNADICPYLGDGKVEPVDALGILRKFLEITPYCQ